MMKFSVKTILSLIVMMWLHSAGAQSSLPAAEPGPEKIPLQDAVRVALEHNQDYSLARLKLSETKEKVNAAWGQLMPVLESEASMVRQYAENGPLSLSDGQYDIKFLQLRFGLNPGVFYNSLRMSQKGYIMAQEELRRVKSEVEYTIIKNYFDLLMAGEMILMHRDSIELLRSNLKDVENLYKTGSVPRFELLQAQVQLKNREPQLIQAENNFQVALDTFNYTLGMDYARYTADPAALKDEAYRTPAGENRKKIDLLSAVALKNRPEIIELKKKQEMAGHEKNMYSSYYIWPTISVGGYYGLTKYMPNSVNVGLTLPPGSSPPDFSQMTGTGDWQNTWQFKVAATYRWSALIPSDSTRAAERESKLKMSEAEEELYRLKRLVAISINAQYLNLVTSSLTIASQKSAVETAMEGVRIARESYRAGVIKNSDLISAEYALTTARTGYINAMYTYYTSLARLKKEMGVDDERLILEDESQ